MLTDFPKIYCPFIRQTYKVNYEDFEKHGSKYNLRNPRAYLVINKINPGYEWVLEDEATIAIEKLNGTNIKIKTEKGRLIALQNRKNVIDPLQIISGKTHIIEGIFRSIGKNYVQPDGEQVGELVGPKVNGNPYKLLYHEWYPFRRCTAYLKYKSFHNYDRTFDNWESWFKDYLFSLYYMKKHPEGTPKIMAEGIVFYNLKRQEQGKTWRAKLRRDMFSFFYEKDIRIIDYDKEDESRNEAQEKFD